MRHYIFLLFVLSSSDSQGYVVLASHLTLNWPHYQLLNCQNWLIAGLIDSKDIYVLISFTFLNPILLTVLNIST